jgi:hypothetical protein
MRVAGTSYIFSEWLHRYRVLLTLDLNSGVFLFSIFSLDFVITN